jgi:hypothetical protein
MVAPLREDRSIDPPAEVPSKAEVFQSRGTHVERSSLITISEWAIVSYGHILVFADMEWQVSITSRLHESDRRMTVALALIMEAVKVSPETVYTSWATRTSDQSVTRPIVSVYRWSGWLPA